MIYHLETPARDDQPMFFETIWGVPAPDGNLAVGQNVPLKRVETGRGL